MKSVEQKEEMSKPVLPAEDKKNAVLPSDKDETVKVNKKIEKKECLKQNKSKLNPNAAHFKSKNTLDTTSVPNLNTDSTATNPYLQSVSYRDLFTPRPKFPSKQTNLEVSFEEVDEMKTIGNNKRNAVANSPEVSDLLRQYILKKCSLNVYCNSEDFDGIALEGLTKLNFVQSLQAVEHYGASVSQRIVKKSAYLMGIIRGQESHWNNSRAAAQLEGGAGQLLHLPKRLLCLFGHCCLRGNCLPSDFTPEVILGLHSLTVDFALKAVNAFDSNKRIVAGCRGGVVNRPRFLQRLIENVIQQNPISLSMIKKDMKKGESSDQSMFSSPQSFMSLLGSNSNAQSSNQESPESRKSIGRQEKLKILEKELTDRIERERRLRQELGNLKVQVGYWEKECHRLNSTISHIMQNQHKGT